MNFQSITVQLSVNRYLLLFLYKSKKYINICLFIFLQVASKTQLCRMYQIGNTHLKLCNKTVNLIILKNIYNSRHNKMQCWGHVFIVKGDIYMPEKCKAFI